MIVYERKWLGLSVVLRLFGSVLPRGLPYAVAAALLNIVVNMSFLTYANHTVFANPHGHVIFSGVLSFLIVFRSSMAYSRFSDGCNRLYQMYSSWTDAAIAFLVADENSLDDENCREFRLRVIHSFSLMQAVALQQLSQNIEIRSLKLCEVKGKTTEVQSSSGDTATIWKHFSVPREDYDHTSCSSIKEFITAEQLANHQIPGPRRASAYMRHRLKSMKMENHSSPLQGQNSVRMFSNSTRGLSYALPVLGGIDEFEISMISPISERDTDDAEEEIESEDPTFRIYTWIMRTIFNRIKEGGVNIPPPIFARCINQMSDGLAGYSQCARLVKIPFPFPYAQLVLILSYILLLTTPILVSAYIKSITMSTLLVFFAIMSVFSLNEVAVQLEQPFGFDLNDLPLPNIQEQMNNRLISVLDSDPRHVKIATAPEHSPSTTQPAPMNHPLPSTASIATNQPELSFCPEPAPNSFPDSDSAASSSQFGESSPLLPLPRAESAIQMHELELQDVPSPRF